MPALTIGPFTVEVDDGGNLSDSAAWSLGLAEALATREGISPLTDRHHAVLRYLRREYEAHGRTPNVYEVARESGVGAQELYALFPGGPVKKAARIAGVPKPCSCV